MTTPLCVYSTVTLPPFANGVLADVPALSSPFREAAWIDEIRWTVYGYGQAPNDPVLRNFGGVVRTKLRLGRIALTHTRDGGDFVPVWSFSPEIQSPVSSERQEDSLYTPDNVSMSMYRWKLPTPLFVPPGSALISSFQRRDYVGVYQYGGNLTVHVSYAGRYADTAVTPDALDVPYVALVEHTADALVNPTFMSDEQDLVNPFLVPLKVQRFIGKLESYASGFVTDERTLTAPNVLIKDSWGQNVIRDYAPIGLVFDGLRRAWTFNKTLLPKERYHVQLRGAPSGSNWRTMISMVGTRKEAFR